jgi:hypothetical protein
MSFNIRYENAGDKGENSWQNRKHKVFLCYIECLKMILDELPDLLGIQEPKQAQIAFLIENTRHLYKYFGKARDLKED